MDGDVALPPTGFISLVEPRRIHFLNKQTGFSELLQVQQFRRTFLQIFITLQYRALEMAFFMLRVKLYLG